MSQRTGWARDLRVRVAGKGVVSHVGSALLRLLGDRVGLTAALSSALTVRGFDPDIDRGRLLADLAVAVADGATAIDDLKTLRHQGDLFGPVASTTTAWRGLGEIEGVQLGRIDRARAAVRAHVWNQIVARHGRIPSARTCYGDLGKTVVIRLDASIVIAHSDKIGAKGTFKGTYGHHPLLAVCDNTGELLVVMLRAGNAGSNTGADHVQVLDTAIAQIPAPYRRDLLVTIDGAGAGHQIVDHITALNTAPEHGRRGRKVEYSIGFDLDDRARAAITRLGERGWEPALDTDGTPRKNAHVAELTGLLRASVGADGQPVDQLKTWPDDLRVIVRREPIPVGMQVSLFEQHDGYRYQVLATNTRGGQLQRLEARHRVELPRTPRTPDPIGFDPKRRSGYAGEAPQVFSEFRDEAVQEVLTSGRGIADVARSLGIHEGTLGNWIKLHRDSNPESEPPLTISERARLRELEKEVLQLRAENVFLGKASAFFAQKHR